MSLNVEYIWTDIDCTKFRSKVRCFNVSEIKDVNDPKSYPVWYYDGSSTGDIPHGSKQTECMLEPYAVYEAADNIFLNKYVLCATSNVDSGSDEESENTVTNEETTTEEPTKETSDEDNITEESDEKEPVDETTAVEGAEEETVTEEDNEMADSGNDNGMADDRNDNGMANDADPRIAQPEQERQNEVTGKCEEDCIPERDYLAFAKYKFNTSLDYLRQPEDPNKVMVGFEQEFFVMNPETGMPVGFVPTKCIFKRMLSHLGLVDKYEPVSGGQGPYYCGNGYPRNQMRDIMLEIMEYAQEMGINIAGFNYEVAPGQAEFQVFNTAFKACNDLMMLRFLMIRVFESYSLSVSFRPVVIPGGRFNNSGCHVNFSTQKMRAPESGLAEIEEFMEYLSDNFDAFPKRECFESVYGAGNCQRLTGRFETSPWYDFSWGYGRRDTSIRIPESVRKAGCGYFEDRRPGANVDPYVVTYYLISRINNFEAERKARLEAEEAARVAAETANSNAELSAEQFTPEESAETSTGFFGKMMGFIGF